MTSSTPAATVIQRLCLKRVFVDGWAGNQAQVPCCPAGLPGVRLVALSPCCRPRVVLVAQSACSPDALSPSIFRAQFIDTTTESDDNCRFRSEGFPSGQRGQTVNLLAQPSKVRILPPPPGFCDMQGSGSSVGGMCGLSDVRRRVWGDGLRCEFVGRNPGRVELNGRAEVFQTYDEGSIPFSRSSTHTQVVRLR